MTKTPIFSIPNIRVYPRSIHSGNLIAAENDGTSAIPVTCFLAQNEVGECILGVRSESGAPLPFSEPLFVSGEDQFFAASEENAALLRRVFPWLNPVPLEPAGMPSFGFGDRLGLATPGHIQALRAAGSSPAIAPVFAQQSVRENTRTGRTPQQVLDEAMWGIFQEGWHSPWGADADHLKQLSDLEPFVKAGYSFYTVDPGEHVDPAADSDAPEILQKKINAQHWDDIDTQPVSADELASSFERFCSSAGLECDPPTLKIAALRAMAKYGQAVLHITRMYRALRDIKPDGFDFEASVDETDSPTTVFEHFYIASELRRLGVRFTSLAPRLTGRFEKGVDFIGDLQALETELQQHVAVMKAIGGYKLSLHSGSDKFSLYPLFARHAGQAVHVKTAGTSYLEALRVTASFDPDLFREILALARRRYALDRQSYHVSAEDKHLPDPEGLANDSLPGLLDDFHVRQALHVTFGSALVQYGPALKDLLRARPEAYVQVLLTHFKRHLDPLLDI